MRFLEVMSELKLYGMRASFDEVAGKGLARRDEIYPFIASLMRAERTHRQRTRPISGSMPMLPMSFASSGKPTSSTGAARRSRSRTCR